MRKLILLLFILSFTNVKAQLSTPSIGNTTSQTYSVPPKINSDVIVSTSSLTVTGVFTIDIDTTLPVDGGSFVVGDITVSNGTKSSFTSVTTQHFTCDITPASGGNVVISVASGVFTSNGFINNVSNTLTVDYENGGIDARIFSVSGQSNVLTSAVGSGDLPSAMIGPLSYAKIFNKTTGVWDVIDAGTTTCYCPVVAFAYYLHARYPSDELYFVQKGVSGTSLATQWGQGTANYNDLLDQWNDGLALLTDRNFLEKSSLWIQGERDSQSLSQANAYQANEAALKTAMRTDFGILKFIDADIYYLLPSGSYAYSATVRTAKQNLVSGDANYKQLDASSYGHQADDVHLNGSGVDSLGYDAAQQ